MGQAIALLLRRYGFGGQRSGSMQSIQRVSVLGIAVGALALITVLSAFNGLEDLIRSYYDRFDPDLKVLPVKGKRLTPSQAQLKDLADLPEVQAIGLVLEEKVFLRNGEREAIGLLKGVSANFKQVSKIEEALLAGQFEPEQQALVTGIGLAYKLGVYLSEEQMPLEVFVPKKGIPTAANWQSAYKNDYIPVQGIFSIQPEFDDVYALAPLYFVQRLLDEPNGISAIEIGIRPSEENRVGKVAIRIREIMGDGVEVLDRGQQQQSVFRVLKSEGLLTYLILALTLAIACFTILGALAISLVEKKRDLFVLWSLGMSRQELQNLYFYRGMLLTLMGGFIGLMAGVLLVWLQGQFGLVKLGQGYAVEAYPVRLAWDDMFLVLMTLLVLGGISSFLGSRNVEVGHFLASKNP